MSELEKPFLKKSGPKNKKSENQCQNAAYEKKSTKDKWKLVQTKN